MFSLAYGDRFVMEKSDSFSFNSNKKLYSAMKVSKLGSLADLTQANQGGMYIDFVMNRPMN